MAQQHLCHCWATWRGSGSHEDQQPAAVMMQGQPLRQAGGLSSMTGGVTALRQLQMGEAFASSKR